MSVAALTWVLENSEAELGARLVMIAIANDADTEGRDCWPSIPRLAAHAHLSERQVWRLLPKLAASGELLIERDASRRRLLAFILPQLAGEISPTSLRGKPGSRRGPHPAPPEAALQPALKASIGPPVTDKLPVNITDRMSVGSTDRTSVTSADKMTVPSVVTQEKLLSKSKSTDSDSDEKKRINGNPRILFRLLDIDPDRIPRTNLVAIKTIAHAFDIEEQLGGQEAFIAWLDAKLKRFGGNEIRYPKILLKRLKQLQRGELRLPEQALLPRAALPIREALRR